MDKSNETRTDIYTEDVYQLLKQWYVQRADDERGELLISAILAASLKFAIGLLWAKALTPRLADAELVRLSDFILERIQQARNDFDKNTFDIR